MSQIYFELASISKDQNSNFRGFTVAKILVCVYNNPLYNKWLKFFQVAAIIIPGKSNNLILRNFITSVCDLADGCSIR